MSEKNNKPCHLEGGPFDGQIAGEYHFPEGPEGVVLVKDIPDPPHVFRPSRFANYKYDRTEDGRLIFKFEKEREFWG